MDHKFTLDQMQPIVYQQLQRSFEYERLAHAYLFAGHKGTGKHEMGIWLSQHLFCTQMHEQKPCGECNNCQRIKHEEHPDVLVIKPEGQMIKIEQIRRLQTEFSRSGYESRKKVFLIQEAEKMNMSAANSLLKFLEESSGNFLSILETDTVGQILSTVKSRCQILHFQKFSREVLLQTLQAKHIKLINAKLLVFLTNSLRKSFEISENEWFNESKDLIYQWFVYLQQKDPQAFIYVQTRLTDVFKEKDQQFMGLSMLLFYYREAREEAIESDEDGEIKWINRIIEKILTAEQKLRNNVSFQSVAEQLVLQIIF